jgi:hypothetical protein
LLLKRKNGLSCYQNTIPLIWRLGQKLKFLKLLNITQPCILSFKMVVRTY